jgi:hypothetical protein
MAKQPSKNLNVTVNSVALEDDLSGASLKIDQQTPDSTSLSDAGPRRVVDNYDYTMSLDGTADFAAAQSDATLFAMLASAGVATAFEPTGGSVGASDPHYDSASMVLGSYSIDVKIGQATKFSAELRGNAALARSVA